MIRLFNLALPALLLTLSPAQACLDDLQPEGSVASELVVVYKDNLQAMNSESFTTSFCNLEADDRALSFKLFESAYRDLKGDDLKTLLRLSIMIPDIAENVAHVAETGELREVDEEWESIGILRLAQHMLVRFPKTGKILTPDYIAELEALFDKALSAVSSREAKADEAISEARETISDYEQKISKLLNDIQTLSDERRQFRTMRQELELQLR